MPPVFVTCFKKDNLFYFLDTEPIENSVGVSEAKQEQSSQQLQDKSMFSAEIDIFGEIKEEVEHGRVEIIENVMRCFGLTKSKESLLISSAVPKPFALPIRERLTTCDPISEQLFQRLRDDKERLILRAVKTSGINFGTRPS